MKKTVCNTELIVTASVLEDGLIEQVENMIKNNPRLFDGETVALMADAHKTANGPNTSSAPVGFTMTLSKGLVPVDYVSSDMFCGVTGFVLENYVPTDRELQNLSRIARDIIPVERSMGYLELTDFGTLGGGNHFVEIGVCGSDTLISVHSGSRATGGRMFKKHKAIAEQHTKDYAKKIRVDKLQEIEPRDRQTYLKSLPISSHLPLLDTALYPEYWEDMSRLMNFAELNRQRLYSCISTALNAHNRPGYCVQSVHNFVDSNSDIKILRKGAIRAAKGEKVIIPLNMRDGVIVGTPKAGMCTNQSLPHGAGRAMSRTKAFDTLDLAQFQEDMAGVISPTICQATLDESPRAYKAVDDILGDIEPLLEDIKIYKTVFNYKGI